jgi:hypothetical protein
MSTPNVIEFERLARAYVAGEVRWDAVHKYAIEMEVRNATNFPAEIKEELSALHSAFFAADERDDPQFRLDRTEVAKLLNDLDLAQAKHGRV